MQNMPQPDLYLMITRECGGQALIDTDGYVRPAPELVAEISRSSVSYDLHDKLDVYRRHGVREYIVWRTLDGEMDYFVLRGEQFDRLTPNADGIYHSECFPGLRLDAKSLLAGDLAAALEALRQGIATPQHADFVKRLKQR